MTAPTTDVIRLWPDGPPTALKDVGPEIEFRGPLGIADGTTMLRNVSDPALTVYRPANAKPNGIAVVVCPGGGWRLLAWEAPMFANWRAARRSPSSRRSMAARR